MNTKRDALIAFTVLMCGFLVISNSVRIYTIEKEETIYLDALRFEFHCIWKHYRGGKLIMEYHHPATLTTLGMNWIEDQLGDSPSTDPAKWIGNSNSTDSPSAAWEVLPDEITTDGLERKAGTYANVGDGQWNITAVFSVTGTNSTQLAGLYYAASGDYLLAADQMLIANMNSGDTLTVTFNCTIAEA